MHSRRSSQAVRSHSRYLNTGKLASQAAGEAEEPDSGWIGKSEVSSDNSIHRAGRTEEREPSA